MGRADLRAHRLEIPYLTAESRITHRRIQRSAKRWLFSRASAPSHARDFGEMRSRIEPPNEVPGAAAWEWLATPGHSPGHISFFRPSDRVLLAGDAFATMNMDSWSGLITGKRTLSRAGAPFNTDWDATRLSVKELAKLRPNVVGCGHGIPMCDAELPTRLERFAEKFRAPRGGRYVRNPARTDERGVVSLPPAPFDPVPFATAGALILAGIALCFGCTWTVVSDGDKRVLVTAQ